MSLDNLEGLENRPLREQLGVILRALTVVAATRILGWKMTVGSKEELQLATVETADALFNAQVIEPASNAPTAIERLHRLADGYLRYVEADTFPGGCFFASALAEVDMQPGPVRERLVRFLNDWLARLENAIQDAQAEGALDPTEDADQLAFEIEAALFLANAQYVVTRTPQPIERARNAIERRLASATR